MVGAGTLDLGASCSQSQVKASEVLWIGDSWVTDPGDQHTRVRDLAFKAGAIGPNDDYVIAAAPGEDMAKVADQYSSRQTSTKKFKVLIMDGGTWDPIAYGVTDTTINNVVNTFKQFLSTVGSDGTVEHIIYFLCPELTGHPNAIPGVKALRTPMQAACEESAILHSVPCHFLDLQDLWAGHYADYTNSLNNIQASSTGARIIADAIWGIMQKNCIAQ
jgi:hypothetical protein